jgi:Tfp pilus assembly protein PilV
MNLQLPVKLNTSARRNRIRRCSCGAFTLAEVMVASMLFTIACLAGYLGLAQGFQVIQNMRENLRATQILQDKTEIVRLYTWDQITKSGFIPLSVTGYFNPNGKPSGMDGTTYYTTVAITNAPMTESYAVDLKQVTFHLSWTNNNIPHQRQITTLVSRYGLHNYVYQSK